MSDLEFPGVRVKLTGRDGNAFSIIGRVSRAIKNANHSQARFLEAAAKTQSYDELLQLVMRTVSVS